MLQLPRNLGIKHWIRDKRVPVEMRLPSRLRFGTRTPDTLAAWTESLSRHLAVVHSRESIPSLGEIQKDDEVALEIDLPERHPFAPRCIFCEGHIGFVSRMLDDRIRLGMIVDRMKFRSSRNSATSLRPCIARDRAVRSGGERG
jgi:hypothetical protein